MWLKFLTSRRTKESIVLPEILAQKTISSLKSMSSQKLKFTDALILRIDEIAKHTIRMDRADQFVETDDKIYNDVFSALDRLCDEDYKELEGRLLKTTISTKSLETGKCRTIAPFANAAECRSGWLMNSIRPSSQQDNAAHRPIKYRVHDLRHFFYSELIDLYEGEGQKVTPYGFLGDLAKTVAKDPSLRPLLQPSDVGREIKKAMEQQKEREQSKATIDEKKAIEQFVHQKMCEIKLGKKTQQ